MKKHQQLPSEFQELLKNAKEVLLEQLKISKKQQNEDFQLNDLLKHLISQQDVEKLRQLFKHQTLWKVRIEDTFLEDILERIEQSLDIFTYMKIIADGFFCSQSQLTQTQSLTIQSLGLLQNYLECQTSDHYFISFEVGVTKKPRVKKQKIIEIRFHHQITFIGFKVDKKKFDTLERIKDYHYNLRFDPYRSDLKEIVCETATVIQKTIKQFYQEQQLFRWDQESQCGEFQFQNHIGEYKCQKWLPNQIRSISLDDKQFKYIFNDELKKWVDPDQILQVNKDCQKPETQQQNKYILDQCADFDSASRIIEIMQGLPEFTIMITNQERNVIASQNNSLVIGRSGTGKTTCCILRIFALQTLMKIRQRLYNQENEYMLLDGDNKIGLHCVFTTLNPVLIGEVRNYYQKLLIHVQQQIQKSQKQNPDQQYENLQNELDMSQISNVLQEEQIINKKEEDVLEEEEDCDVIDAIQKFHQISEKQFPIFLSINKLLLLIDASLHEPFFQQDKLKKNADKLGRAGWNTGNAVKIAGAFKSENQLNVQEINSFNQINENIQYEEFMMMDSDDEKQKLSKLNQEQTIFEYVEVDFNYFQKRFWPTVMKNKQKQELDLQTFPTLLWTQIYSFIKGSQQSYSYPLQYLPRFAYYKMNPSGLSQQYLKLIYDFFLEYEKWKSNLGVFDLMDLVNYLICQIDLGKWCAVPIHYMFVDEVQDLPHAVLQLFSTLIEQGFFYCGDTAQNIVQGVGFRFQDIKNVLKSTMDSNQQNFKTVGLTINFRSHNSILQLANSVVTLIELLFPKAIDRLNKEISDLNGPLPIIIEESEINSMIKLFENGIDSGDPDLTIPVQFGCNQVVLVRSEEDKEKIPKALQGSQILTIFESKGLEFEDVILYNFFSESSLTLQQWELLNYLFIEEVEIDQDAYNSKITRHPKQLNTQADEILANSFFSQQQSPQQKSFFIKKLRLNQAIQAIDLKGFCALSDELKQLYVAITRAKQRIIIFDNQLPKRVAVQKIWKDLGIIQIINEQNQVKQNLSKQNTREEWRIAGKKMFQNKHYEQAGKCFRLSGDQLWEIKSNAYTNAKRGEKTFIDMQSLIDKLGNVQQAKEQIEKLRQQSYQYFALAGDQFLHCNLYGQAAACFFSGQNFEKSLKYYIISKKWNEAGEAALQLKLFDVAGILFLKGRKHLKSVEAFKQFNKFICLHLISQIKNLISNVYFQIVLELLPQVLNGCLNYFNDHGNQIPLVNFCNFSIISENNNQFKEEFQNYIKIIEGSYISIENRKDLFNTINFYIKPFTFEFMDVLSKVFINYDLSRYKETLWQPEMTNEKNNFILNVLEYFDLTHVQLFFLEFIGSNDRDNYLISCLYEISPLYQPCLQLQELLRNQSLTELQTAQLQSYVQKKYAQAQRFMGSMQLLKLKNPSLTIFSIIILGFYEQIAKHSFFEITLNHEPVAGLILIQEHLHYFFKDQFFQSVVHIETIKNYQLGKPRFLSMLSEYFRHLFKQNFINDEFETQKSQFPYKFNYLEKLSQLLKENKVITSMQISKLLQLNDSQLSYQNYQRYQNQQSQQYYQNLESLALLLSVPLLANDNQYQELLKISQQDFQLFTIILQQVVDLFKYNRYVALQQNILLCIQSIFQVTVAISSTFQLISQTYIAAHRESIIFNYLANNYSQQNYQCFQIDAKGELFLFSSIIVIEKIQSIYKQFLTKYVSNYCVILTKKNNNQPFILEFYVECINQELKIIQNSDNKQNHFLKLKQQQQNETLQNCLFSQLCDQMFSVVYQIYSKENKNWQIFYDLATSYFTTALTDQTLNEMHIHILTAINLLHLANCYDKSKQFIENLIKAREENQRKQVMSKTELKHQHPFLNMNQLQHYQYYIEYLMTSSICFSIKTISDYIYFEKGLNQILFFEQRMRDLTFCILTYLVCNTYYSNNICSMFVDESLNEPVREEINLILPEKMQLFLTMQEYFILPEEGCLKDENINELLDIIINLAQNGENQAFILLVTIIINMKDIKYSLAKKLDNFNPSLKEEKILDFLKKLHQNRYDLQKKFEHLQKNNFSVFEKFKLIDMNLNPITNLINFVSISEEIIYLKQKKAFNSLYFGMRIVTFQPLIEGVQSFGDYLVGDQKLQQIYDEFNLVRSQLFEILYMKQLQKSVNYISIMQELEKLEEQEQNLDNELKFLQNNELKNEDRDAIFYQDYLDKIENSRIQIKQWIKDNNQLTGKLQEISYKLSQNQQKQTTAMCLIKRRGWWQAKRR